MNKQNKNEGIDTDNRSAWNGASVSLWLKGDTVFTLTTFMRPATVELVFAPELPM